MAALIELVCALAGFIDFILGLVLAALVMCAVQVIWPFLAVGAAVMTAGQFVSRLYRERCVRIASERAGLARSEWEDTTEGRAYIEQARREALEEERRETALAEVRRVDEERRRSEAEERAAKKEWNAFFKARTMQEVASMTGPEFERFLARLLPRLGYTNIVFTPVNDQGGDILCACRDGERVVVQAKRWKGSIGNKVVQELLGALLYYCCDRGIIVTNSTFTARRVNSQARIRAFRSVTGTGFRRKSQSIFHPRYRLLTGTVSGTKSCSPDL